MTEAKTLAPDEARQKLKFYQKGTFTVGNRLVSEDERSVQASEERSNALTSGHRACQGCGEALGARYAIDAAMRATDNDLIAVNATGCLEVFTTPYPETSWQLPWLHSLVRQCGGGGDRRRGGDAGEEEKHPGDRPGRRRRHHRHRLPMPFGHVRAQRRRALHLLRQRRLYEHRRPALIRHAAGGAHSDHACASAQSRAMCSGPANSCRKSPSPTTFPMSPRRRWPICTILSARL